MHKNPKHSPGNTRTTKKYYTLHNNGTFDTRLLQPTTTAFDTVFIFIWLKSIFKNGHTIPFKSLHMCSDKASLPNCNSKNEWLRLLISVTLVHKENSIFDFNKWSMQLRSKQTSDSACWLHKNVLSF